MTSTNIGLDSSQREKIASILNVTLADHAVLYQKTRHFHWNVTGPFFNDLHSFFEEIYDELEETIDEVAERVRALGVFATGSLKQFLGDTRLSENSQEHPSSDEMIIELLADHETVIRNLREDSAVVAEIGDTGTEDFLIGIMEAHEKTAWKIRSLLD